MSVLCITPEYARLLDWAWVRLWLAFGGGVVVQEMPSEYPALFVESPRRDIMH